MNAEVKAKWVAALRSGEYHQGTGYLGSKIDQDENGEPVIGYCCLGVLCEVAVAEGIIEPPEYDPISENLTYSGYEHVELTPTVRDWAGLETLDPEVRTPEGAKDSAFHRQANQPGRTTLASLNDADGFTFAQIADVIEEQF